jgi:hypothetical protein
VTGEKWNFPCKIECSFVPCLIKMVLLELHLVVGIIDTLKYLMVMGIN